ncbi:fatty acyl-AMP ligase [Polaromonas sp. JS666]|uniref:fatty acyl-AMP ligase n=1 Tax=Polaromonas sp. (strain JS666 / ATCC BAA-500) TaxID=296591 RepID=UPI00004646A1|nr:fatty acyl-AMP ligase [Polaromonas sp. JS666]
MTSLAQSILRNLDFHAEVTPEKLAYRFLPDAGGVPIEISYGSLRTRAWAIAAGLLSLAKPGDRALIMLPSGLEFIQAFLGCLYAGVIAVPLYPPRPNQNFQRLASIHASATPALAITTAAQLPGLKTRFQADIHHEQMNWVAIEALMQEASVTPRPLPSSTDIAFIQYTSGSTSAPKGVVLSHGTIVHNQEQIRKAFRHDETDHVMGWLPAFHDMGLIGNILQPLYLGIGCTLMSHLSFLQRPFRWLQAISMYQATTSGGPNFAYQLCVQKISEEQKAGLNLSSWKLAFCGAEVVRPETINQFSQAFHRCGFDRQAIYPCYGLAEATLFVAGAAAKDDALIRSYSAEALRGGRAVFRVPDETTCSMVSCGTTFDHDVRIVNPATSIEQQAGEVGEIWIHSGSVALGYWNNDVLTREVFDGRITSDTLEKSFLRTGDLGFFDEGKNLFITGRLKDLIIVRGRNHAPTDIEFTVERSHPSFRQAGCAAFAVDIDGEERLVVAQEIERTARDVDPLGARDAACEQVTREHGLKVYEIVFVRHAALPRTSSGKIQRYLCAQHYLNGMLALATFRSHAERGIEEIS